jgi:hypothetical protein
MYYCIKHLPTNTLYAVKSSKKQCVVFFKKYDVAKYVADSISTNKWIYNTLPDESKELYIMKKYQVKRQAMESKLWVHNQRLSVKYVKDLASRNVDLMIIDDIEWINDENYNVLGQHVQLTATEDLLRQSLEIDNELLFE